MERNEWEGVEKKGKAMEMRGYREGNSTVRYG